MIKTLKSNRLFNTRNAILYNLLFSLVLYIRKYYNKDINNTTTLQVI